MRARLKSVLTRGEAGLRRLTSFKCSPRAVSGSDPERLPGVPEPSGFPPPVRTPAPENRTGRCIRAATRIAATVFLAAAAPARAHAPGATVQGDWWSAWNWDPLLLLLFAATWWFYSRGLLAAWQQLGTGRRVSRAQASAFAAGLLTLFLALVSPLDLVSAELSSAHMGQHMLLMMVAAPLLALGSPLAVFLWALPARWRKAAAPAVRRVEGWYAPSYQLWQPVGMWTVYAATLWLWHLPALYQAALRSPLIHDFQHLGFLLTSYLFWKMLLDPVNRLRLSRGTGVLYLFTTCLHASALGIFMTFSPRVWYLDYGGTVPTWHLTALEDQQLAGLIMWMPGCLLYAVAAAGLFAAWVHEPEDRCRTVGRSPRRHGDTESNTEISEEPLRRATTPCA